MLGEIAYMIVWGFFSAMGWMAATATVDKISAEQQQQQPQSPPAAKQAEKP